MTSRPAARLIPLLGILALLVGCSGTTEPGPEASDVAGSIDPGAGTFTLKSLDVAVAEGHFIRLDLIGSDLVIDDDGEHVGLTVAVRNAGARPLPAPVTIWLHPIEPASVFPANPDTSLPVGSIIPYDGYIYDEEFGDDMVLDPDETSRGRFWNFHTPDQGSFSFGIRVELPVDPDAPTISGVCFHDVNRNGVREADEPPMLLGDVHVVAPDSSRSVVHVAADGTYAYPLSVAGLHRVAFVPNVETFVPLGYSTPNPRQVLITVDADGALRGFDGADFGVYNDAPMPPGIHFTDDPPDSLHRVPWDLLEAEVADGRRLVVDAAYSGCQPLHRFSLWMSGGFMESLPIQASLVIVHETDEACDAAFRGAYVFDLGRLRERFYAAYGPGLLQLNVIGYDGTPTEILLEVKSPQL